MALISSLCSAAYSSRNPLTAAVVKRLPCVGTTREINGEQRSKWIQHAARSNSWRSSLRVEYSTRQNARSLFDEKIVVVGYTFQRQTIHNFESRARMLELWGDLATTDLLDALHLSFTAIVVKCEFPHKFLLISAPIRNREMPEWAYFIPLHAAPKRQLTSTKTEGAYICFAFSKKGCQTRYLIRILFGDPRLRVKRSAPAEVPKQGHSLCVPQRLPFFELPEQRNALRRVREVRRA